MSQEKYDYAVFGGDMRMVCIAKFLQKKGYHVCQCELCSQDEKSENVYTAQSFKEAVRESKILVLPIPITNDKTTLFCTKEGSKILLADLLNEMKRNQILFGGCISEEVKWMAKERGVKCYDFMKDECLAVYNSIATAEGAIAEAITRSSVNLNKSQCIVLGYGKCGKTLASCLKGMLCQVTVCARRQEVREEALVTVDHVCDFEHLEEKLSEYLFIFNTIPELILGEERLEQVNKEVCIIDIASVPYGVDYAVAKELGLNASLCSGLPGKYAPEASARAMAAMITARVNEKGEK